MRWKNWKIKYSPRYLPKQSFSLETGWNFATSHCYDFYSNDSMVQVQSCTLKTFSYFLINILIQTVNISIINILVI